LALGTAAFLAIPFFHSTDAGNSRARFFERQIQFRLLKDMLLAEPSVTSVGPDNVREFWFFDGRWSSPRRPGLFLSREEMLKAVDLSPRRYDAYLDLLKTVGGYRAVRSGPGLHGRVAVQMFAPAKEAPSRVVYDPALGASKRSTSLGGGWFLETDPG
jgi:hypothetical protein